MSDEDQYQYSSGEECEEDEYGDEDYDLMDSSDDDDDNDNHNKNNHNNSNGYVRKRSLDNPNAAPNGHCKGNEIRMLDSSELLVVMKRRIKDVTEVLGVPQSAAAVLLRNYQWNKERLVEMYLMNPEAVQKKCGVTGRCEAENVRCGRKRGLCGICYENPVDLIVMPCTHGYCEDCWVAYLTHALLDEGPRCVLATCPHESCAEVITEDEVGTLAPNLLKKFESYQLRHFVDTNAATRWCPGPGCDKAAMGSHMYLSGVAKCIDCDSSFCLSCGEEPHAPISCKELIRWNEKCRDESETANWILANTKACPKCSSRIEKNQGCNHMTCRQCRHEFCWICMGSWSSHGANTGGYYKCNKYDETAMEDESNAAKRELDRYLHYYKRFHAHAQAQTFAQRQLFDTESRMVRLQESTDNATWTGVEFLKHANLQLIECRRVLKYTYAFAYYLTANKHKERFEHHQEMLEKFTECLSEHTEKPLNEMDRETIVNHTRVVKNFMKNILQYVEDGMDEE
eukprot:CAMPEP_0118724564 /NCGR_PEP_ID=MMETSP0800-20121206/32647_1 /TAXON_ID=210618 ORGANISM="Striatella unipunctata, Strain CCMP2910" /NCGR_SAMPLE_ID=MMETSP0800 /ASSEMBLY_ACC=CAM_ASM_000638 /LENGTH=511 /DNA_ID=CAMNT_0006633151 /DNA_START=113 /DNA_END=1648 /DNA_ORIENTATION=-